MVSTDLHRVLATKTGRQEAALTKDEQNPWDNIQFSVRQSAKADSICEGCEGAVDAAMAEAIGEAGSQGIQAASDRSVAAGSSGGLLVDERWDTARLTEHRWICRNVLNRVTFNAESCWVWTMLKYF